jgi:hypothetical protein
MCVCCHPVLVGSFCSRSDCLHLVSHLAPSCGAGTALRPAVLWVMLALLLLLVVAAAAGAIWTGL